MKTFLNFLFAIAVLFFLNFEINSCVSGETNEHNNIHNKSSSVDRIHNFGDIKQIVVDDRTKDVSLFYLQFTDVVYHKKIILALL